jgi:hypothetical protein
MKFRKTALALLMGMVMILIAPLTIAAATRSASATAAKVMAPAAGGVSVPVTGTTSKGGKFTGTFNIQRFSVVNNQIVAVGTLTGTISNSVGNVIGTVLKTIQLIVNSRRATCDILELELGPLDLDLLGLQVHLDKVVLEITADPNGGLLGSLLCAVANLLNGGGLLSDIANLLNQILALL